MFGCMYEYLFIGVCVWLCMFVCMHQRNMSEMDVKCKDPKEEVCVHIKITCVGEGSKQRWRYACMGIYLLACVYGSYAW